MSTYCDPEGKVAEPLPSFCLDTLRKRQEFREASNGRRFSTPGFTMLRRPVATTERIRFGFTVTKKLGNAVIRNRIRRRLRQAVRANAGSFPAQAMDLVILARSDALRLPFPVLAADIGRAIAALAKPASATAEKSGRPPRSREKRAPNEAKLGKPPPLGIEGG